MGKDLTVAILVTILILGVVAAVVVPFAVVASQYENVCLEEKIVLSTKDTSYTGVTFTGKTTVPFRVHRVEVIYEDGSKETRKNESPRIGDRLCTRYEERKKTN